MTLIDTRAPVGVRTSARITCRVCNAPAAVLLDHPALLCLPCLVDLDITAGHVAYVKEQATARCDAAWASWIATLDAADDATANRWGKVADARNKVATGKVSQAAFDATWQRAKAVGGAFADLLAAYEALEETTATCDRQLVWAEIAEREIEAARAEITKRQEDAP